MTLALSLIGVLLAFGVIYGLQRIIRSRGLDAGQVSAAWLAENRRQ